MRRRTAPNTMAVAAGVVAWQTPSIAVAVAALVLVLLLGVVLPAVWSARAQRRRSALVALRLLLGVRQRAVDK